MFFVYGPCERHALARLWWRRAGNCEISASSSEVIYARTLSPWATEYLAQFSEAEVLRFLKDPKTSKEVRNLAYAYFTPEEFPTHRMLQELMMLDPVGAERDQIMEIATCSCRGVVTAITAVCLMGRATSR